MPDAPAPVVPLREPLIEEPEADPDADPDAAVFSFGWPVAWSRQCVAAEILLEPAPGEDVLDD
jgi:hypothetical protein